MRGSCSNPAYHCANILVIGLILALLPESTVAASVDKLLFRSSGWRFVVTMVVTTVNHDTLDTPTSAAQGRW